LAAAHELQTYSFLFFMTNDNDEAPPQSNDAYWNVGDNGKWKEEYNFPVYVLPGASGATLINATADYSGNLSSVPNSQQLLETEDPTDFVRLYVDIDTGESNSQFPGTSIFFFFFVLFILLSRHYMRKQFCLGYVAHSCNARFYVSTQLL
jgi:hypothetical protein